MTNVDIRLLKVFDTPINYYNLTPEIIQSLRLSGDVIFVPDKVKYLKTQIFDSDIECVNDLVILRGNGRTEIVTDADLFSFQEDASKMFKDCRVESFDLSYFDTSNVTNMCFMFGGCTAKCINLCSFDTSNVSDMRWMFSNCQVQSLDLSTFNTSNVGSMCNMFHGCAAKSISLSNFDTHKVINMCEMFRDCYVEHLDLSNFDTSNVKYMSGMFNGCKIKSLDLLSFNTSKLEDDISAMFANLELDYLDISMLDLSNIKDISFLFSFSKISKINFGKLDTKNVINMQGMFYGCTTDFIDMAAFNTENVRFMEHMFKDCKVKNTLDFSNFSTRSLVNMESMFDDFCTSILDLSSFDTSNVYNFRFAFRRCKADKVILTNFKVTNKCCYEANLMFVDCDLGYLDIRNSVILDLDTDFPIFCRSRIGKIDADDYSLLKRRLSEGRKN